VETRTPGSAGGLGKRAVLRNGGAPQPEPTRPRRPRPRSAAVPGTGPPGQRGSRRWRRYRRRQRVVEARHARRVRQAQHEAAAAVVGWAVARRIGTLAVGDPRGVLGIDAGRRHNRRTRDWRVGRLISVLRDKAEQAGIIVTLLDERGTSSTCPACRARVPKPAGRLFCCPHCGLAGHRDLIAAANIAGRLPGGITPAIPAGVTHRRAGNHLPGVSPARRDPRRRPHHGAARGFPGRHLPAPPTTVGRGVARPPARTS
jgi:IS605 OrfB family transposase